VGGWSLPEAKFRRLRDDKRRHKPLTLAISAFRLGCGDVPFVELRVT
jgi:hypothetical protein